MHEMTLPIFGDTYSKKLDGTRIGSNRNRIWSLMRDRKWRTKAEIRDRLGLPADTDIGRRLRELRHFGTVERVRVKGGVWAYRFLPEGKQ